MTTNIKTVKTAMEQTADFNFCWWNDKAINGIITDAVELGWVLRTSTTQVEWTDEGVAALAEYQPVKTQIIAGHRLTLAAGKTYRASRPIASQGRSTYPVSITKLTGTAQGVMAEPTLTVNGLDYDQANKLINDFNSGPTSFDGRLW